MWKLLGIYVIVRVAVSTDEQIRRCLWLSVAAASIVALVAIMQSLSLLGVPRLLAEFFGGPTSSAPAGGRGSSTLGLPAATADLMIFNLAIVTGLWTRYRRHRLVLTAAAALMLFGALAAGEFSGAIGLVVGVICIAIVSGSPGCWPGSCRPGRSAGLSCGRYSAPVSAASSRRPACRVSWIGRLNEPGDLLLAQAVLGLEFPAGRPSPRLAVAISQLPGNYVWIESGYTWLLWGGGIPLLASFIFFIVCDGEEQAGKRHGAAVTRGAWRAWRFSWRSSSSPS